MEKTGTTQIESQVRWFGIVQNDPKLARIYELAGFSRKQEKYMGQFGLVVRDKNGNNTIIPN